MKSFISPSKKSHLRSIFVSRVWGTCFIAKRSCEDYTGFCGLLVEIKDIDSIQWLFNEKLNGSIIDHDPCMWSQAPTAKSKS